MKALQVLTALMMTIGLLMFGATAQAEEPAQNMFGGPVYAGAPDLALTAALVHAGGGADHFGFDKALVSMLGEKTVNAEVEKLTKQYGKESVEDFIKGMTWAVNDALKRATEAGVKLPEVPKELTGATLAKALVKAGTTPDKTWWAGYLFDKLLSNKIHNIVMADINREISVEADSNTHKILNQAMYDVAQALGEKDVKLAKFH